MTNEMTPYQRTYLEHMGLSPREIDVVASLMKGHQNKEIGADLKITEQTVKFHITSINKKIKTKTRVQIISMIAALPEPKLEDVPQLPG